MGEAEAAVPIMAAENASWALGSWHTAGDAGSLPEALFLQFILWGVLLPIVALFGFIGNMLTMVVLWRREMQSPTIYYLRGLVVTDTGILLAGVVALSPLSLSNYLHLDSLEHFRRHVYPRLFSAANYAVMTLQTCNVWMTVCVSLERFIAICLPFEAPRFRTYRNTSIVLGVIGFASVTFNLPRLLATQLRPCPGTVDGDGCLLLTDSDFGRSFGYKVIFRRWMYVAFIYIVPVIGLFLLNIFIIRELLNKKKRRRASAGSQQDFESNITAVLIVIVIVFIACQTPGVVAHVNVLSSSLLLKWLAFSNFFVILNSAVNFVIYTAIGRKFASALNAMIGRLPLVCCSEESSEQPLTPQQVPRQRERKLGVCHENPLDATWV